MQKTKKPKSPKKQRNVLGGTPRSYIVECTQQGALKILRPTPGTEGHPCYMPKISTLKERWDAGNITQGLKTSISYLPVIAAAGNLSPGQRKEVLASRSLLKGKALLGVSSRKFVKTEEIQNAIDTAYPQEKIEQVIGGARINLMSITQFRQGYERVIHSAYRSSQHGGGGLRGVMERYRPGLYDRIAGRVSSDHIDENLLASDLLEHFYAGGTLNEKILNASPFSTERKLAARVRAVAKRARGTTITKARNGKKLRKEGSHYRSYRGTIQRLTNLRLEDIAVTQESRLAYAALAEQMTYVVFQWAPLVGLDIEELSSEGALTKNGDFFYRINMARADLRKGNQAIEVKTGIHPLKKRVQKDIEEKYIGERWWRTGERVSEVLAVLHQNPSLCQEIVHELKGQGVKIIDAEKFQRYVKELVPLMERRYGSFIQHLKPRIALKYLPQLAHEMAYAPYVLLRKGNHCLREHTLRTLGALIEAGNELAENSDLASSMLNRPASTDPLTEAGGKIQESESGECLVFRKSLEELPPDGVSSFLRKNERELQRSLPSLSKRLQAFQAFPADLQEVVYIDAETVGSTYRDPVFMISCLSYHESFEITAFFARTYAEEKNILQAFLQHISGAKAIVTYNGAFDISRLNARFQQNGLMINHDPRTNFAKKIKGMHYDLLYLFEQKNEFPDAKLQTIETLHKSFQTTRADEIRSDRIPAVYQSYVDGMYNHKRIMRIVEHNMRDVVTPAAILTELNRYSLQSMKR